MPSQRSREASACLYLKHVIAAYSVRSPPLPHKGGGSRPSLPLLLVPISHERALSCPKRTCPAQAGHGDETSAPKGQRVSTMKSVPLPVSEPSPLSEMMSEAPGDISSEIRSSASGGIVTRPSASLAFDAGPTTGAAGGLRRLPFTDFLTGSGLAPGIDTTFQRSVVLSSLTAKAVKTWVPSGRFGSSNVIGASNTGSKPLRTNSLPSLRLMNTEIGPGLSGRGGSAGFGSGPFVSRGVPSA